MFSNVEISTSKLGLLFITQNRKNSAIWSSSLFTLMLASILQKHFIAFMLGFWFLKVWFISAQINTFYFVLLLAFFHPLFFSVHLFPLFSCCKQDIIDFQNPSSHKRKSNMLIVMSIILRCLQTGLKHSNSFVWEQKADQSPQSSLFTASSFVGEMVYWAGFSHMCRLETFIALISSLSLSSPSLLLPHITAHRWLRCMRSNNSTFITLCIPFAVVSAVAIALLITTI